MREEDITFEMCLEAARGYLLPLLTIGPIDTETLHDASMVATTGIRNPDVMSRLADEALTYFLEHQLGMIIYRQGQAPLARAVVRATIVKALLSDDGIKQALSRRRWTVEENFGYLMPPII